MNDSVHRNEGRRGRATTIHSPWYSVYFDLVIVGLGVSDHFRLLSLRVSQQTLATQEEREGGKEKVVLSLRRSLYHPPSPFFLTPST